MTLILNSVSCLSEVFSTQYSVASRQESEQKENKTNRKTDDAELIRNDVKISQGHAANSKSKEKKNKRKK